MRKNVYNDVRPDRPGGREARGDDKVRQAAIEFCSESRIHQVLVTPVNLVADQAEYTLVSPEAETDPVAVIWGWANGNPIFPMTKERLATLPLNWRDDTATTPSCFLQPDADTIQLYPKPSAAATAGLRLEIAICPALDATGVADWLGRAYVFDLANGCKALMMESPGKPWSTPDYAMRFRAKFEHAKKEARIAAARSLTNAQQRVRMSRAW